MDLDGQPGGADPATVLDGQQTAFVQDAKTVAVGLGDLQVKANYLLVMDNLLDLTHAPYDRILPRRRNATNTRNLVNFFRVTPDNRLLFGGRARFAAPGPESDPKSGEILRRDMVATFPYLSQVRIDYCWGGLVDMTRDRLPRAGERDGVYYSMGYSGHGTQMSTYMGTVMADIIDGGPDRNPWKDFDWPAIPGHFGPPWFLPMVGAYYRFKDKVS